jgi:hypothetical protein
MTQWWKQPLAGDIVWCHFPEELQSQPAHKPRPALILEVYDDEAPQFGVQVAYGTSKRVTALYAGEFSITQADGEAYRVAGLSFDTKFNLARRLQLPFNDGYFAVPPSAPHGQHPKLGALHASLMRRASAAFDASNENLRKDPSSASP